MGSEAGGAKPVQFAAPVGVRVRHQIRTPPLEPEACRGERRDGQETDTEHANGTSRVRAI